MAGVGLRKGFGALGCPEEPQLNRAPGIRRMCDLHVHTTASDGLLTPEEVVKYAARKGLSAVAISDHDTIEGVRSLLERPREARRRKLQPLLTFDLYGVEVVPAVEINCEYDGHEVHILGYFVPLEGSILNQLLEELKRSRVERVRQMVEKLEALGMPVDFKRVMAFAGHDAVGRPHVARVMVEKGYVSSVREAFERYLGIGKPAYVERFHLSPSDCVRIIRDVGAVPVWAHPESSGVPEIFPELLKAGLLGIEAEHPDHSGEAREKWARKASEHGLLVTGGSDFHGPGSGEGGDLGSSVVPYDVVSEMMKLAAAHLSGTYLT